MSTMSPSESGTSVVKERVWRHIESEATTAVELLRDLVKIPSPNPPGGGEKEVADLAADYMRGLGMEVTQHEFQRDRTNNIGRLRGKAGSPVLLFNSHLDTTPVGDPDLWTYPPYGAVVHDGYVYGRGSNNMKVGLAAALFALKALRACDVELRGDVVLTQTADEMNGGFVGLGALVQEGLLQADYAIYTEAHPRFPDLRVEIGARGLLELRVITRGYGTVFGAQRVNAIEKMAHVINRLTSMQFGDWQPQERMPAPIGKIPPTVSTSSISGFRGAVLAPDECEAVVTVSYFPPQTEASIWEDVNGTLDSMRDEDLTLEVTAETYRHWQPVLVDREEPIVAASLRAVKEATGLTLDLGASTAPSDMRWLVNHAGIPACKVAFGSETADRDERQSIEDFIRTIRVYATLMVDLVA